MIVEQDSDSQIWKIAGPGSGFKNFGTGLESKSEKVTPATSADVKRNSWPVQNFWPVIVSQLFYFSE